MQWGTDFLASLLPLQAPSAATFEVKPVVEEPAAETAEEEVPPASVVAATAMEMVEEAISKVNGRRGKKVCRTSGQNILIFFCVCLF